jgi:maltooligosyltrehalose trehalohydrolase
LFAPHQSYGGSAGLKYLVDACHQRGIAVILDVVYSHLGPDGNNLDLFGPYFTDRYRTPWGRAINFDGPGSDEVRRFVVDNALMWLRDYHLDGLHLAAVHAIKDESAVHILEELAAEVERLEAVLGRHLVLTAESDLNDPRIIRRPEAGGYGLDAQWCGDFHHALHAFLTGEQNGYYRDFGDVSQLVDALQWGYVFQGQYSDFHQRRHGRPVSGLPGHRFIAYLQNHDGAGSPSAGERISQLLPPEVLKVAMALVLTSPFVPMLFMGEEWGADTPFQYFTDFPNEVVGKAVWEGRRSKVEASGGNSEEVPDPQSEETFERSRLDWSELKREPHNDLLDWTRKLIQLRYQNPFLINGNLDQIEIAFDEGERWLIIQRDCIIVACNLDETFLSIPYQEQTGEPQVLLSSNSEASYEDDNFFLPANSVMIVQV